MMADYPEVLFKHLCRNPEEGFTLDEISAGLSDFGLQASDIDYLLSWLDATPERISRAQFALAFNKTFPLTGEPSSPSSPKVPSKSSLNALPAPTLSTGSPLMRATSPPQRAGQLAPISCAGARAGQLAPIGPAILVSPSVSPPAVKPDIPRVGSEAIALFDSMDEQGKEWLEIEDIAHQLCDLGFLDASIEAVLFGMGKRAISGRVTKQVTHQPQTND
jgi:hypothetical protein